VRIGGSGDLPCPLWRVQRHVGGGVRKVYFLHTAALAHSKSHAGQVFSPSSCTYRCQNHRADSLQGRWLLARLRSRTMQSKMRSRLGAFYLFGALGKNSLIEITSRPSISYARAGRDRQRPHVAAFFLPWRACVGLDGRRTRCRPSRVLYCNDDASPSPLTACARRRRCPQRAPARPRRDRRRCRGATLA